MKYKLFIICSLLFATMIAQAQSCYAPDTAQAIIFFTTTGRPPVLESEFSISDTTKVHFASGNLLYQPSTKTWRLAPRQYDIVGGYCSQAPVGTHGTIWEYITNTTTNKKEWTRCTNDNTHNASYEGWIDLFAWGTSGWYGTEPEIGEVAYNATTSERNSHNPKKKVTAAPYEVNNSSANYKLNGIGSQGFDGDWANADWGVFNNVMLGGTPDSMFRTPTLTEATYLFGGRPHAHELRARARIRIPGAPGKPDTLINGVILLPDDWNPAILPADFSFKSDADGCEFYSDNEYTSTVFDMYLEPQGAIFLPAAGGMSGQTSIKCNRSGYYWGATPCESNAGRTYDLQFGGYDASGVIHSDQTERRYCRAVRLVAEIKVTSPEPEP